MYLHYFFFFALFFSISYFLSQKRSPVCSLICPRHESHGNPKLGLTVLT